MGSRKVLPCARHPCRYRRALDVLIPSFHHGQVVLLAVLPRDAPSPVNTLAAHRVALSGDGHRVEPGVGRTHAMSVEHRLARDGDCVCHGLIRPDIHPAAQGSFRIYRPPLPYLT